MKCGITYGEALEKARPGLRHQIETSVALLRKAEALALRYDPEDGFFLAFSGGKDSQVLYHVAELAGVKFKAWFSPTSMDPPQVIRFIREEYPEVEFLPVKESVYALARKKKTMPTMKMRWCCAEFKESAGAGKVTLTGVRHQESTKRAKRREVEVSGHKFAGDLYEFFSWSEERIRKQYKNINNDQFSREKESEVRCISGKDSIIINPIIEWSPSDVWDFLNKVVGVRHCRLYDPPYNQHRIGCILCPMASYKQKLRDTALFPYAKEKWIGVFEDYLRGVYLTHCRRGSETVLRPYHSKWIKTLMGGVWIFTKRPRSFSTGGYRDNHGTSSSRTTTCPGYLRRIKTQTINAYSL